MRSFWPPTGVSSVACTRFYGSWDCRWFSRFFGVEVAEEKGRLMQIPPESDRPRRSGVADACMGGAMPPAR